MYTPRERVIRTIAATISSHRAIARAEGMVGKTCAHPLCRENVTFLTIQDGADHQAVKVMWAITDELEEQREVALEAAEEDELEGVLPELETIAQEAS